MKKNSINTFGNRELSIEVLYDVVFQGTSKLTHLEDLDFPFYALCGSSLRNVKELQVSGKKYNFDNFDKQNQGKIIFEFLHCPFEGQADKNK